MTTKWIEVNDLLNVQHSLNKNIRFKTSMVRSDYSDAYIVLKEAINIRNNANNNNMSRKYVVLKNNAQFR